MDFFAFVEDANTVKVTKHPWMDKCNFVLGTDDNLTEIFDHCLKHPRVATDLETTGLDNRVFNGTTVDKIVGLCLCPDGFTGYYIPLRHTTNPGANVSWPLFVEQFERLVEASLAGKLSFVFHGGQFDMEFLEFNGDVNLGGECWDKAKCWDDTEIEVYMTDSRRRDKRLKSLSEKEVGIKQIELDELWSDADKAKPGWKKDFGTLDPEWEGTLLYGGGDGIATWRLDAKFHPLCVNPDEHGHSLRKIYQIEKACVAATRWMKRNRIKIDRAKVTELIQLGQHEWFTSIMEVYEAACAILQRDIMPGYYKWLRDDFVADDMGNLKDEQITRAKAMYQRRYVDAVGKVEKIGPDGTPKSYPVLYDVNAPQQLGMLFEEMGVPGLVYTEKSGQVKTSKDVLDAVVERAGAKFPFMVKIKRFREVHKALSNYLMPMLQDIEPSDDTMAINFRGHKVDTGRFATPAGKKKINKGWPKLNLQSIPAGYDPNRPECMRRLRECIIARDGKLLIAIDYAGVELRLVTNLSREPKWLEEYFHCSSCDRKFKKGDGKTTPEPPPARCPNCGSDKIGDLHTLTALQVYGADATEKPEWKQLRQRAKGSNFALCYGGGGAAVSRSTGCDKNEGWRIKSLFDGSYRVLRSWWGAQHAFARKREYVLTAFGRKYPVPDIHHGDGGFRSKAERNAVNGPIQGSSADVTKLAMFLVYKEIKKRGWIKKVLMVITMHDELVFEIDPDILEEAIEVIKHIMCRNRLILAQRWPIPLTSDVEIGFNYSVPWDLNSMRAGEVRFHGNKKYYKAAKAAADGHDWDAMPKFPAALEPHFKHKTFEGLHVLLGGAPPPKAKEPTEPVKEAPATPEVAPVAPPSPTEPPTSPEAVAARPAPPSGLKAGSVFEYQLNCQLSMRTLRVLAAVLLKCRNKGTRHLRVVTQEGVVLNNCPEWDEFVSRGGPLLVNDQQFFYLAQSQGL
jgi:DNA polymerase I-like protein with 3'-5' exonuclease and polymerase domains